MRSVMEGARCQPGEQKLVRRRARVGSADGRRFVRGEVMPAGVDVGGVTRRGVERSVSDACHELDV